MKLGKGDKLVMIGDSITDCGRSQPEGEGLFDALGKGYVAQVEALLTSTYPDLGIRVVNKGCSGNTVRSLKQRWQSDVLDVKPDWLSIMIGINDVWRQFDSPTRPEGHVYIDMYEEVLEDLVIQTKPQLKGLVLMTPYYIEPNAHDGMRAAMDNYGKVVARIAHKHDAIFVDTQAAFNKVLDHIYPATLGWDRVHPGQSGHMVITKAFLNAIDFKW
jgi:lysophospholipase L1-like esterase